MYTLDYKKYAKKIREAAAESVVLLKNENNTLPIKKEEKIAIFGRAQIDTYYCGTGSGGMVNIPYLVNIVDGLKQKREINKEIYSLYEKFVEENPFDKGAGWAMEPFSQVDLKLENDIIENASKKSDVAVFVIARSAGEDKDCLAEGGSYYLNETEKDNLKLVTKHFKRVVVVLNIGGVMDLEFINSCNPSAILIAWHGGIESGNGYADVLCGDVNPSGALPDTIAYKLEDYPSTETFGSETENIYKEDIFVGYRYFETFAKEKVLYPFGYGLSYTDFVIENADLKENTDSVEIKVTVKNTGKVSGKKAVQIYVTAPIVKLAKPKIVLAGFSKTKILKENEAETLTIIINKKDYSSFDDEVSAFILEKGSYVFSAGFNSRDLEKVAEINLENEVVIEKCTPALMPIIEFSKMSAVLENGKYKLVYDKAKTRPYNISKRIKNEMGSYGEKTNNGYTFNDVKAGKITALELANDLSSLDLIHLSRGEGMCSPKVTSGTAGCFGGVTNSLLNDRKIPIACCSDGPSGIRMDSGTMAISIPNATAIASSFNVDLVKEIFDFLSIEMLHHKIDTLLGPGMNIHRNPLCGRNFEYYSEDPFLTGKMAVAQIQTMNKYNITGTVKHFIANNQEKARKNVSSVISARAIREIYLKGFEMAVKEGNAYSIMTAYNPINGIQAASNYDLNTTILRKDWGFKGVVMTDWWATMNKEGGESSERHTADMIISQNDVYMVNANAFENSANDDSETEYEKGNLTRYPLVRNAENIINTLLKFNCSKEEVKIEVENVPENKLVNIIDLGQYDLDNEAVINHTLLDTSKGSSNNFVLNLKEKSKYKLEFNMFGNAVPLAQLPMSIKVNGALEKTITLKGQDRGVYECTLHLFTAINAYVELFFGESGLEIDSITIKKI